MVSFARLMLLGILGVVFVVGAVVSGGTKRDKDKDVPAEKRSRLPPGWAALDLTDEQTVKLDAIVNAFRPKIAESEKKVADLKVAEEAEVVEVLTEGQKAQLLMQQGGADGRHKHKKKDK